MDVSGSSLSSGVKLHSVPAAGTIFFPGGGRWNRGQCERNQLLSPSPERWLQIWVNEVMSSSSSLSIPPCPFLFFFLSFPLLFFSSVTRFTEASDVICRQPARYWLETRASDWFSARHNSDNVQKKEQRLTLVWNRNALVISHVLPSTGNNLCFQQERH